METVNRQILTYQATEQDAQKKVETVLMGRLEIYPILVLFSPRTWKR